SARLSTHVWELICGEWCRMAPQCAMLEVRLSPRKLNVAEWPRKKIRGIKYLRVLASGAPARRSQRVSGALCEAQRRSHQRDGARDFVSGPRAPNQRPCSHQARLHRSLPRRRESNLSPPIWGTAFARVSAVEWAMQIPVATKRESGSWRATVQS